MATWQRTTTRSSRRSPIRRGATCSTGSRARRPHAHGARVRAGDDPLRRDEAPQGARGRGSRRHPPRGTGEAAFPEPRPDPADPRPVDRQVHRAPRLRTGGPEGAAGGDGMSTTTTETATQVYQLFIRATPERIWEAIVDPAFTERYFYGAHIETTPERRVTTMGDSVGEDAVLEWDPPRRLSHGW